MVAKNETQFVLTTKDNTAGGFASVESRLSKFSSQFSALASPIALVGPALAVASAGLVASVKSAIDTGDQFSKLSQKTGIAVESLSALAYAGDLSGVSIDELANGIKKLSVNMSDAAGSATGKAAEAFKALGIAVQDNNGMLRASEAVLADIADSFANMKAGARKTALAVALFGKAGSDLIPLLNQGSKGIAEMTDEAENLGLVMSGKTAKGAEDFSDNLTRLGANVTGLGRSITADLIGPLNDIAKELVTARNESSSLVTSFSPLTETLRAIAVLGANVGFVFRGVGTEIGGIAAQLAALGRRDFSAFSAISEAMKEDASKARADFDALELRLLGLGVPVDQVRPRPELSNKSTAPALGGGGDSAASGLAKKNRAALERMLELGQRNLAELGDSEEEARLLATKRGMEDVRKEYEALQRMIKVGEENELAAYYETAGEETMRLVAAQRDLRGEGLDTYADLTRAVEGWGNAFTDTLADVVMGGKAGFSDLANSIVRDLLRIQIQKNITKPLVDAGSSFLDGLFKEGIGSIFGGARAGGGPVDAGRLYLVGERGPELFAPGASGSVIPNGAMGGGSVVVNVIESPGRGGQQSRRNEGGMQVLDIFVERVKAAIAGDIADGRGAVPSALQSSYGLNRAVGGF